jgi:hypothetical protein
MAAASVGATASNLVYGDAVVTSARRHLSGQQFPVKAATPMPGRGWTGPLGSYGQSSASGSSYGYGATAENPQY